MQPGLLEAYYIASKNIGLSFGEEIWQIPVVHGDEQKFEQVAGTEPASSMIKGLFKLWLPGFAEKIWGFISERLMVIVKSTQAISPAWQYFIDDDKYNRTLAKKQLLTPTVLESLPKQVTAHHSFVTEVSSLCTKWDLGDAEQQPLLRKALSESSDVLSYAQKTVSVGIAVRTLENLPKGAQAGAAAQCLSVLPQGFPNCLRKLLQKAKAWAA